MSEERLTRNCQEPSWETNGYLLTIINGEFEVFSCHNETTVVSYVNGIHLTVGRYIDHANVVALVRSVLGIEVNS